VSILSNKKYDMTGIDVILVRGDLVKKSISLVSQVVKIPLFFSYAGWAVESTCFTLNFVEEIEGGVQKRDFGYQKLNVLAIII